ncbi:MAG: type II toxin-antitoxin system RelE/ParE family toxin [Gammaproteobacteria bacterium]|nr:type II toxin-antitoxin system RelE/ParE family toxin [Gammaproteobacteria bacterium]
MTPRRVDIPPHVAAVLRTLHPDLKKVIKAAVRAIALQPDLGDPLRGELAELRKFRVRRFRIIYQAEARSRTVRLLAVGPRRTVYEDLAAALKPPAGKPRSRG